MSESGTGPDGPLVTVQFSPCVGGLVRTWTTDGASRLWSVPEDAWLRETQAHGKIGRSGHAGNRFRETAQLVEDAGTLLVRPRIPLRAADGSLTMAAQSVGLAPEKRPSRSTYEDFREVLTQAVEHCTTTDEFLVVERGGPAAEREPFCLFAVMSADTEPGVYVNVVETAPPPRGSELWAPYVDEWDRSSTMSAPSSPETAAVAPLLMIEAISRWGIDPWDLVFTFGTR